MTRVVETSLGSFFGAMPSWIYQDELDPPPPELPPDDELEELDEELEEKPELDRDDLRSTWYWGLP